MTCTAESAETSRTAIASGLLLCTFLRFEFIGIKRYSKPGLRKYAGVKDLPRVRGGLGTAIVSTSQGVMADRDARKKGIGGEVVALIW